MSRFRAFLYYRIPMTQQSLTHIMIFIIYIVINIICLFVTDTTTANALLVAIPATRNSILVCILGYSFDTVMVFHRWIGRFLFLVATIHMIGWYILWYQQGYNLIEKQFSNSHTIGAALAWIALFLIQILSLNYFRRNHFNFFYHTHFLFLVFYGMAWMHWSQQAPYFITVLVIYGIDRLIRTFWGIVPRKTTLLQSKADGNILQVRFPKHPLATWIKLYKVGAYVFVNFPSQSLFEWHPFSISSAPNERTAEIHIRALGDYTRKMMSHVKAQGSHEMWIRVDGPYGNHRLNYHRYPSLVLIGGEIGITPIISILKDIYHVGDFHPKTTPNINSIEGICVIWVIPHITTYDWFADELAQIQAISQSNSLMPTLHLWIYVTRESDMCGRRHFVAGKPDMDCILECVATDYPNKATCVFACGPQLMVTSCWDATNARKRAGDHFDFHMETFEW